MDPNPAAEAALQCAVCGTRRELPGTSLRDLHRAAREAGRSGRLSEDGTALAALCPDCGRMPCPHCGAPYREHGEDDDAKPTCTRSRR